MTACLLVNGYNLRWWGVGVENMLLSIIKVHVVQEELEMFLL
jgi:hypothetical protein